MVNRFDCFQIEFQSDCIVSKDDAELILFMCILLSFGFSFVFLNGFGQ